MQSAALVRSLTACSAAVVIMAGGAAVATCGPTAASTIMPDGGMRFDYGRRPSPLLICKPQYVCDIALESGENVLNVAIGDASGWVIASGKSGPGGTTPHVFVKPTQSNLETNLLITTTKRAYDITLRSASDSQHPHISFFYADEDAAAKAVVADHERQAIEGVLAGNPQVGADKADTKYKVTGDATLVPAKVFNDGARTFVQWKTLPAELPTVVAIGPAGAPQPQNFRIVGTSYVIDNTSPNFDLVLGAETDRHGRPERRASVRHE
jgi:P-type conjugative transfer protein TrbG